MTDSDDLYGLPLEQFVAERNALAKGLRGEGDREGAQKVAALRKPSVAAWAVNQLVRTRGSNVQALFDAGDALRQSQSELLGGHGDGGELRATVAAERDRVDELTKLARGLLSSEGHELTPATLDRVSDTLHAAALDDDARAKVKDGRLERELRHVGIGGLGAATLAPAPPAKRTNAAPARSGRAKGRDAQAERAERDRAAKAERERAEQVKAARHAEGDARRHAERAQRELRSAGTRRDRAAEALREAEQALAQAEERAEAADAEHQRAQQTLDEI